MNFIINQIFNQIINGKLSWEGGRGSRVLMERGVGQGNIEFSVNCAQVSALLQFYFCNIPCMGMQIFTNTGYFCITS